MQPHSVTRSFLQTAIVLGLLMAIGPFAIDMYLPALPMIGRTLNTTPGAVQASLTAFFVALGVGQVFYGPLSDMLGRKAPLYFGVGLFGVGSVGCALASDIETLVALRFVQGLGACVGMVVPRAVVRDLHTGAEATRLMAMLLLVFSVSPILAPLAGSLLIDVAGWRSVFWAVSAIALLPLLGFGCYGLASPALSVLALDPHGPIAGTASALMGTLQFVTGAVVMAVIGWFVDGSARPMLLCIAGCASLALVLTLCTLGLRTLPHQPG